ncbi:replication initiation protein (plasmid) [Streptomyces sp. NBC_01216]|uniref:replication initiation protein n=1 Tax=Streptomyces sp. NBC_01216 TaxID=2903778 RepID=UPI002E0EC709|nr:replication initiation protein [Streptomyces sp. NBC_01216]
MNVELPGVQWNELWLPLRPYATNRLQEGIRREQRPVAMTRRYVEANPSAMSNLLVVDVDHSDAVLRAVSSVGSHPLPNAVVENPVNGHAHAVWALAEAVTRTEYARRKPLAYAAAVTEGLRRALDGDAAYSGLMTKNPLHTDWSTEWFHGGLHTLGGLEEALSGHMPPARWRETKRFRTNITGLGRNCSIFETARTWAYREVRHHFGSPDTSTPPSTPKYIPATPNSPSRCRPWRRVRSPTASTGGSRRGRGCGRTARRSTRPPSSPSSPPAARRAVRRALRAGTSAPKPCSST